MTGRARLGALLVLLGLTAAVAYRYGPPDEAQPPIAVSPGQRRPAPVTSRAATVGAWKADILARPLIYPGRRAPSPAPAIVADRAATEPAPRLTGVIVGPSGRHALFVNGATRPVTVDEGGRIGPYVIRTIRANEVVVDGPGGTQTLHPVYDGAPPQVAPGPPQLSQHAATVRPWSFQPS